MENHKFRYSYPKGGMGESAHMQFLLENIPNSAKRSPKINMELREGASIAGLRRLIEWEVYNNSVFLWSRSESLVHRIVIPSWQF